ncbi:hypothetical protein OF897_15705 [Chryseobacterium formosus]|uniref:Tetratricopeptide repeat protein n=1 Tax=Chryseobacterium formosus TaxID=1537363 RepID=A0ABT3XUM8_9FLAO|nr:hypothetical protein [Chryseobacterium formosus]MCX8525364.1 hypothetical protein [Chryseobacterium formosus]
MKRIAFLFFTLFVFNCAYSQQKSSENANNLLRLSELNRYQNGIKSLEYAKKAYDISKELKNDELIAKSSISIAYQLFVLEDYKKSLSQISDLEKTISVDNEILKSKIVEIKYVNYNILGLEDLAIKSLDEYIDILEKVPSDSAKQELVKGYFYYAYRLQDNDLKKANNYINKALQIGKTLKLNETLNTYMIKASICMGLNQMDSAQIYISKAFEETKLKEHITYKYAAYELQGDYYFKMKDYEKAVVAFQNTLAEIDSMKIDDFFCQTNTTAKLADIYAILRDKAKEKEFREKYQKYNDHLKERKNEGLKQTIDNILNEQEEKNETLNTKNKWIVFLVLLSITIAIYFYFKIKKTKRRKKIILQQNQVLLTEKSELEKEKDHLNKKADENKLAELIELAKKNSPEFTVLFEEIYPNFIKNIKAINPKISNSELHFVGLAFLNFTTKEIADFTFVTVSAVQLRKYRIRKKYMIPSDEDFNVWMRNLNTLQDNF